MSLLDTYLEGRDDIPAATLSSIRSLAARDREAGFAPHPGEQHHFETTCTKCGEHGHLFVAIYGPDERARIEPLAQAEP